MRLSAITNWNYSIVAFIIGIFIMFSYENVQSQTNTSNISNDSTLFLTRLQHHFLLVQKSKQKEAEIFLKDFTYKWETGFFSNDIKTQIYLTADKMWDKKMPAIPYFSDYFSTLMHLIVEKKDRHSILTWMHVVKYFLENKNYNEFSSFLRASDKLFTQNIIFSDQSIKWITSNNQYSIEFQNDTLKYVFPETGLICYTKGDSCNIIRTKGEYFPFSNTWVGDGGTLGWERANYSIDSVYAELNQYSIRLQFSNFLADSVLLHHSYYFNKPIIGKLEERVMASRRGSNAVYPKFESYEKLCEIPNIFPNIDFKGGVIIEGRNLLGFGDETALASLLIKRNDTAFVKLRSTNFTILPNQIMSSYASISIRFKNDSIYHSGLHMNYSKENQLLSLFRDDKGITANPFYDTYHQIEIYVEALYWKMNENQISFDMALGRTKTPAHFESFNYFSVDHFNRLQGIDSENPLQRIKRYSDENASKFVYFDEYAKYLKMPIEQVKLLLLNLAHQGFLLYDSTNGRAVLGDKIDFYLKANLGNIDSDDILFQSLPEKNQSNANLQIDNFDLQINGLGRITLSDSQNLVIEPTNHSIVLGKNKNFSFDGKITAGRISFATTHSDFNYDEFKINMPSIDSLWFWVKGAQLPNGDFEHKTIQNAICNLSGDLLIDHPSNKSGKEALNEYPIFNSKKDSYVYYNKKNIQNGVYKKENFYFHVNPFTFSSLNNFVTDEVTFTGYLSSAGIFPDISQPLTVQDDYSLGFTNILPAEGIMAYGDKGKFFKEINLSNKGLRGNGELTFINSLTTSNDFLFLPDSANVLAQSFDLKPTTKPIEFPRINASNIYQHWMPYKETMQISTVDENIKMYDDATSMKGTLLLSPTSLTGKGEIHFKVAKMYSDNYTFKNQTFDSPKTNFVDDGNILNNFSAHTNYTNRTITFVSNDGTSKVDFPENLYICFMDQATWYMDKDITDYASSLGGDQKQYSELTLRQLADTEYKGSNFISLHPNQDSLTFFSTVATFNARDKIIEAQGVHYIKIADAVVFPANGSITIFRNAEMTPLQNSKIITNAVTKYHEIINAIVKIESRKSYRASGDYVYTDKDSVSHPIHFSKIMVDSAYQTIAKGEILPDDYFTLSPKFYFRGNVNLKASRKLLEFDGGFKIINKCQVGQNWIKFNSVIDPENVRIPIEVQPMVPDASRQQKFVGILNSAAQRKVYSAFLDNKIDYYDPLILTANGFIIYDEDSKEFRISSAEKLNQMIRPDNYFSLRTNDCSTYGEGKVDFNLDFQDLTIESYGNINLKYSTADLHIGTAINFHFSNNALKNILDQFTSTNLTPVDNSSPFYSKMIAGFLGIDQAEQYLSQLVLGNMRRVPIQLQHTIMLNDLKLKWNSRLEAYISDGDFGIENIDRTRINAIVKGKVEIKKNRSGDELIIYFEINNQWYFFKYSNNVMQVLSSNEAFNEIIQSDMDSKSEKNKLKQEKGLAKQSGYRYILSTINTKDDFLNLLKIKNGK